MMHNDGGDDLTSPQHEGIYIYIYLYMYTRFKKHRSLKICLKYTQLFISHQKGADRRN